MKGLNFFNGMGKVMKMPNMENKMNILVKTFVIACILATFLPINIFGQTAWKKNSSGAWCIYEETLQVTGNNKDANKSKNQTATIYTPSKNISGSVWFFVDHGTAAADFYFKITDGQQISKSVKGTSSKSAQATETISSTNSTAGNKSISYGWTGSNRQPKQAKPTINLPGHYDLNSYASEIQVGTVNLESQTSASKAIDFAGYFKSFYATSSDITVTIEGTDKNYFSFAPNNTRSEKIAAQYAVFANSTCFAGGDGETQTSLDNGFTNPLSTNIIFSPLATKLGKYTATLNIKYNNNTIATVTLTGYGKKDPTIDWSKLSPLCVANPAPTGYNHSITIPDNAFWPSGIDLTTAAPSCSSANTNIATASGRTITAATKAGKVTISVALQQTDKTNAKTFTKEIFVDHYGNVMDFGNCYALEMNSKQSGSLPADVDLTSIINASQFTTVTSDEIDFRPRIDNNKTLHVDFLPSTYASSSSNNITGTITVSDGANNYHVNVKGTSVIRNPSFDATKKGYHSDPITLQNIFYGQTGSTHVAIVDNGHHYQYLDASDNTWKFIGRATYSGNVITDSAGFYISNTVQSFQIRFAPTDLYRENGVILAKGSPMTIRHGNTKRQITFTAQPLRLELILNTSQSFSFTATDAPQTINRSAFTISTPEEKRLTDYSSDYNNNTYRSNIKFSLEDKDNGIITLDEDNIVLNNKAGSANIIATLSPSESGKNEPANNFEEAHKTITVTVGRADRGAFTWPTVNSPVVFSSYPYSVTLAETQGTTGSVSYEVTPADAATIENGKIKFNKVTAITVKAKAPETVTYNAKEESRTYNPAKVQPVISWTGDGLGNAHQTLETINLTGTIQNKQSNWTSDIKLTYKSSNPAVAEVKTNSDGSYYVKTLTTGTATITAEVAAGSNNESATPKSFTINVNRKAQTINWAIADADLKKTEGYEGNVTAATLGSSELANSLYYNSTNTNVATINEEHVLKCSKAGITVITPKSDQNGTYLSTDGPSKVFIVNLTDFGTVNVGSASETKELDLSSCVGWTVTSSSPYIFRIFPSSENGSTVSQSGITVPSDGKVKVKFVPNYSGTDATKALNGTITLSYSDISYTFNVSGTGKRVFLPFSENKNFGTLDDPQKVTLENMTGAYTAASEVPQVFRVDNSSAATVSVGNDFYVYFMPQTTNKYDKKAINITETSTNQVYTVYATGKAAATNTHTFDGEIPVGDTHTTPYVITLSGFASNLFDLDIIKSDGTSVRNSFLINNSRNVETLVNGQCSIYFAPQEYPFPSTRIVAREKANSDVYYELATITATSAKPVVSLEWVSQDVVKKIPAMESTSGLARVTGYPAIDVYYKSYATTHIGIDEEHPDHPGWGKKLIAYDETATTVEATIFDDNYTLSGNITSQVQGSSLQLMTIGNISDMWFYVGDPQQTLNAKAYNSNGQIVQTANIVYTTENDDKSVVEVLNNTNLKINGSGNAVLIVQATDNAGTYESTTRRISVQVTQPGQCQNQLILDIDKYTLSKSDFNKIGYFESYSISNSTPAGSIEGMTAKVGGAALSESELTIRVWYHVAGEDGTTVHDLYPSTTTETRTKNLEITLFAKQDIPDKTDMVYVQVNGYAYWGFTISEIKVSQEEYIKLNNTSKDLGDQDYDKPRSQSVVLTDYISYSALDENEIHVRLDDPTGSFSLDNPNDFKNITCTSFSTMSPKIGFRPKRVGPVEADLYISAKTNGESTAAEKQIHLTGTGVALQPQITWNQDLSGLKTFDADIPLSATVDIETTPIKFEVTAGSDYAEVKKDDATGIYYLHIKKAGNVTVTASQPAVTDDYGSGPVTIIKAASASKSFTITGATPTITFTQSSYTVSTLDNSGVQVGLSSVEHGKPYTATYSLINGGDQYYTLSADNKLTVKKYTANKCTVQVKIEATEYYSETYATALVQMQDNNITLTGNEVTPISTINSVSENIDVVTILKNAGAFTSNYTDASYTITPKTSDVAIVDNYGLFTAYKHGEFVVQVNATSPRTATSKSENYTINIDYGTMTFNNATGDKNWGTQANWAPRTDIMPSEHHNVSIEANCTIPSTYSARVHGMENSDTEKLVLKADENNSATLIFEEGSPKATVEIYMKGETHYNSQDGMKNPEWQYRGFIGNPVAGSIQIVSAPAGTNPSVDSLIYYRWNEAMSGENKSCWVSAATPAAWDGYSMANMYRSAAKYSYKTVLIPTSESKTYTLTYTGQDKNNPYHNNGVNIVTNSYSAPIKVSQLALNNMEQCVYFFKTTYYYNWSTTAQRSDLYVSCPSKTCPVIYGDNIPAGQSFLVQASNGKESNIVVTSDAIANQASGPLYAPEEKARFNILEIKVKGNSAEDEVYLLESDECNRKYDNGYDGLKMFSTGIPQIYANNSFGGTSINADSSMLGQYIGFRAAADVTEYEITFDIDRLEGYDELYLFDHLTKRYADILAGSTYRFTATEADDPERFQIMGRREDGTYFTGADQWIEVVARRALLHGFDDLEETVRITDLMGNLLWTDNSKNGPWFDIPEVPAGVYIIHCGKATAKFIVK